MPNMFKRNNKHTKLFGANFYILKVDNRKTEKNCEICSKSTIKTPE